MHFSRNHLPEKDVSVLERLLTSSDDKLDRIFADLTISFASQIFTIKKKDAFVDTKLTKMLLEKEMRGADLSPEMRRAYKFNLKKLQGEKGASRLRAYLLKVDELRQRFIDESSALKGSSGPQMIENLMNLARNSFGNIGKLQIESISEESDIAFEEGLLSIRATYDFLKDGFSSTGRQSKTVRSRITDILTGNPESFIDAKRRSVFLGLEMTFIYLNDQQAKKEKKISDLTSENAKLSDEVGDLISQLRGAEASSKSQERIIESLRQQVSQKTAYLSAAKTETQRIEKEKDALRDENELMKKELEELRNLKKQIDEGGYCSEDGRFWQTMALELEDQLSALSGRFDELHSKSIADGQKMERIEKTLKDIYENHLDRTTSCRVRCEQNISECNADDMISYIAYGNCSMDIKQDCAEEIIRFLDFLIDKTSKGASSGMNVQSASHKGKGNGKYANNFLNPIINFLRETYNKKGTQAFLEKVTNIEWKKLLEEYRGGDIRIQSTKKHMIIADVHRQFKNDESSNRSLFEALSVLPQVLERIDKGNTDLTTLCTNISEALAESNVQKRLYLMLKDIIKS